MSRSEFQPTQRDLQFTAAVVLAAALARDEQQRARTAGFESRGSEASASGTIAARDFGGAGTPRQVYQFTLLAASSRPEIVWPEEGWRDARHRLAARVELGREELRLHLQAEGFAALSEVSGCSARISSPDGSIDQRFRFDSLGRGLVVLGDSPAIRRALSCFEVGLVDESDDRPGEG